MDFIYIDDDFDSNCMFLDFQQYTTHIYMQHVSVVNVIASLTYLL